MGVSIVTDTVYTYRFLKLLVTPFNKTEAFKLGLIDASGRRTDKPVSSSAERAAFNLFHRLVFNLKRLMNAFPGGNTRIASYAAALALLREQYNVDTDFVLDKMDLTEEHKRDILFLLEQYNPTEDKKKKKKKVEKEEFGTSTVDVATIPTPMKFKAFLRRKKVK